MWNCFQKQYAVGMMLAFLLLPVGMKAEQEAKQAASVDTSSRQTARELKVSQPIEQEIKGGEIHIYFIDVPADRYVIYSVEQTGNSLVVATKSPNKTKISEYPIDQTGTKKVTVHFISEKPGEYSIEIKFPGESRSTNKYVVRLDEVKIPTQQERDFIVGVRLSEEAELLARQQDRDSLKKAVEKLILASSYWKMLGNKQREGGTLTKIGNIYYVLAEFPEALKSYEAALPLLRETRGQFGEAVTLSNLASIYDILGEPQKALDTYQKALELRRLLGDTKGEIIVTNGMATAYLELGENRKALELFDQSLQLCQTIKDPVQKASSLTSISTPYSSVVF